MFTGIVEKTAKVLKNSDNKLSIERIFNELKSAGIPIGKNALYQFLDHAETIFMIGNLKKYSHKISTQELSEKKVYAIDNGLANAVNFRFSADLGKALEQIVFWELKRRLSNIEKLFYYREKSAECDFIIQTNEEITDVIQVCYQLDDLATKKREIKGLLQACKNFGLKQGRIITYDSYDSFKIEGIVCELVPVIEFLN